MNGIDPSSNSINANPAGDEDLRIDPNEPKIDVRAKFALQRMRDGTDMKMREAARILILGRKSGELGGIYGDDLGVAVKVADDHKTKRWLLVPEEENAALVLGILDKKASLDVPPTVIFRGDTPDISKKPGLLEKALKKASQTFEWFQDDMLVLCASSPSSIPVANLVPPSFCRVPPKVALVGVDVIRRDGSISTVDRNFSPLLKEKARFRIRLDALPGPFEGTLRVVISRPTDDGFGKVAILEQEVRSMVKQMDVVVEWAGKTDRAVPRQLSERMTTNLNDDDGTPMHIPLREMVAGDDVRHGVYVVERLELAEKDDIVIASNNPKNPGLVVPVVCTILFNTDEFVSSLGHFGIGDGYRYKPPYFDVIREAIVKVTSGYYDGIGIRFETTQRQERSIGIEVEIKEHLKTFSGWTRVRETGPRFGILHNIFAWCEESFGVGLTPQGIYHPSKGFRAAVGPSSMLFHNRSQKSDNSKVLYEVFGPLGVPRDSVMNPPEKPKVPKPRTVTEGKVEGQVTDLDVANTSVSMSAAGVIKVTTTNPSVVPTQRATDIQRALNALANSVGTIAAHELGHCQGLVADPGLKETRIDIPEEGEVKVKVSSPLSGDHSHNQNSKDHLMDPGPKMLLRHIFTPGRRLPFRNSNWQYLRDCFPEQP